MNVKKVAIPVIALSVLSSACFVGQAFATSKVTKSPKVAFTRSGDIFTMNSNGSCQTNITKSKLAETSPSWSPDQKQITFLRGKDKWSTSNVWVMAANGKSQVQMTSYKSGMVSSPEWSPNGKQIAYILSTDLKDGATANRLLLMDVATKKATSIYSYDKVGLLRTLSWSPDGSKIAVSWTAERVYLDDPGSGFGVVDVKTRKYTNANLSGHLDPIGAAWSPDGKSIAFIRLDVSSNFAAKTTESVISVNPDGTGAQVLCTQQITNAGEVNLDNISWAPSGKILAFTRIDYKAQKNTIYAIDVAAKKAKAFIANATEMDW